MKIFFTIGVGLVFVTNLIAGDLQERWYPGSVVLANQIVITGNISVYPEHDVVVLRTDGGTTVLPAHKIESVFYYDSSANINRRYISRVNQYATNLRYQLFEVVVSGNIPVIRKRMAWSHESDDVKCFTYYIVYEGTMLELHKFRNRVYPNIIEASRETLVFVKQERLNPNQAGNAIKIIQYYNRQFNHAILAMN